MDISNLIPRLFRSLILICLTAFMYSSCKETSALGGELDIRVSQEIIDKISELGYCPTGIEPIENDEHGDGWVVEDGIILYPRDLNAESLSRIPNMEQYRTTLVPVFGSEYYVTDRTTGERVFTRRREVLSIDVDGSFSERYMSAIRDAVRRYNDQSLRFELHIRSTTIGRGDADINIIRGESFGALGRAGFPFEKTFITRGGSRRTEIVPYNEVTINPNAIDRIRERSIGVISSVVAHEIGHCIGFRHTDFFDRSISCQGLNIDEGQGEEGAVHIPGTPTDADLNSWMLACSDGQSERQFTHDDIVALRYLHGW